MATTDELRANVEAKAQAPEIVQRLAERIGLTARAAAVFGEPVKHDDVTVIPVARTAWGFGGGGGGEPPQDGAGGGAGGLVSPIGFIEVRSGDARFVPIRDLQRTAVRLAATAAAVGWILRRR